MRILLTASFFLLLMTKLMGQDKNNFTEKLDELDELLEVDPGKAHEEIQHLYKFENEIMIEDDLFARYLYILAEDQKNQANYELADSLLRVSIQLYVSIGNTEDAIDARMLRADCNMYWGQYDTARSIVYSIMEYRKQNNPEHNFLKEYGRLAAIAIESGDKASAYEHYQRLFNRADSLNLEEDIYMDYANFGVLLMNMGRYAEAIEYEYKALSYADSLEELLAKTTIYRNISLIHKNLGNYEEAEDYLKKSLKIARETKANGYIAAALLDNGLYKQEFGDFKGSLPFFEEALSLVDSTNSKEFYARCLNYMSWSYYEIGNKGLAFSYARTALRMRREIRNNFGIVESTDYLGYFLMLEGDLQDAEALFHEGIAIGKEEGFISLLSNLYNELQSLQILKKDFKSAYYTIKEFYHMRDSAVNSARAKETRELEVIYQSEKKKLEIQNLAKENKLKDTEIELERSKTDQEREQKRVLYAGVVVLGLFMLFVLNRFQLTRKKNKLVKQQKLLAEERRHEAEEQKELVEEKNKEILDSINYARRLQEAILPPQKLVKEYLPDSFILYKPKDIVAGDFYWMETVGDTVYFAAADCTGHGVPGAMVSVVCSNALSKSLIEEKIADPAKILDRTRELVISRFGRSEEEVKDGMDISLCALNLETRELQWAGANNPLWIIRPKRHSGRPSGDPESAGPKDPLTIQPIPDRASLVRDDGEYGLFEVKADKQPIGKYAGEKPFTTHTIQLSEGDSLYIFSDGFPDQFGGEKGKKYKSGKLKKYFLSIVDKPHIEQRQLLLDEFENWRGEIEQIDDVCIIGVRV